MSPTKRQTNGSGNIFFRIHGTPRAVAYGFSAGVMVGMTPLIGLHTALALIIAIYIIAGPMAMLWGMTLWTAPVNADHPLSTVRHYIETNGQTSRQITWDLKHGDGFTLTYITDEETHTTCTTESFKTISWTMNAGNRGSVRAERQANTISIRGKLNGRNIDKRVHVDDAPWFQATSLSLKGFILSDKTETTFWTLRPDTLKAYKLKAVKAGEDTLTIGKHRTLVEAVKVKLSLTGMLASFFCSHYWFNTHTGMFLRFQGQGDISGKTQISVVYTGDTSAFSESDF